MKNAKPDEPKRCNDLGCDEILKPGRTGLCPMCEYDYAHMTAASERIKKANKDA